MLVHSEVYIWTLKVAAYYLVVSQHLAIILSIFKTLKNSLRVLVRCKGLQHVVQMLERD